MSPRSAILHTIFNDLLFLLNVFRFFYGQTITLTFTCSGAMPPSSKGIDMDFTYLAHQSNQFKIRMTEPGPQPEILQAAQSCIGGLLLSFIGSTLS